MGDMLVSRRLYQGSFEISFKKNSSTKPLTRIANKKLATKIAKSQIFPWKSIPPTNGPHQQMTHGCKTASEPEPRAIPSVPLWPRPRHWRSRGQLQVSQLPGSRGNGPGTERPRNMETIRHPPPSPSKFGKFIHSFFLGGGICWQTIQLLNFWGVKSNERSILIA